MTAAAQGLPPVTPPVAPPVPDADSAFFWAGLREHRLLLQKCEACARFRFPPMPSCPWCASMKSSVHAAKGTGTVYSWIVVRRAFDPAFAADVPYILATVDFDEGGRSVGRLVGTEAPAFGMRVSAAYADHPAWTELRFQPLKAS